MKLKARSGDFKVTETLREDLLVGRGAHTVYRVTKRKETSLDAARLLGELAGVAPGSVAIAGLKDRQGETRQFMSAPKGRPIDYKRPEIDIETVGYLPRELVSTDSTGNAFEIVVRDLEPSEITRLRASLPAVREHGLPNYFDEQRFGNLRHDQGWIALELLKGRHEVALKNLLTRVSPFEADRFRRFKSALYRHWGDWRTCRDIAGRFGAHHSVFEHLRREPTDFGGAFRYVATRIRLIHLFAFQSHLWNRAVARVVEDHVDQKARFAVREREGKLQFPKWELPLNPAWRGQLPLPGARLEGVEDERQRALFSLILEQHELTPATFQITGVPGFGFKTEARDVLLVPRDLRVRPSDRDPMHPGRELVRMQFGLARGSYATLVVKRLIGSSPRQDGPRPVERSQQAGRAERGGHGRRKKDGQRGQRGGQQGGQAGGFKQPRRPDKKQGPARSRREQ